MLFGDVGTGRGENFLFKTFPNLQMLIAIVAFIHYL